MAESVLAHLRTKLGSRIGRNVNGWLKKRLPRSDSITLDHRNIFILPTSAGTGFLLILALIFTGAANYESSLGFGLFFLLLSTFLVTILHTVRNLMGLEFSALAPPEVYAGGSASIEITIDRHSHREYESIRLQYAESTEQSADLISQDRAVCVMQVPATKRGLLHPGRLTVDTRFPLGLFRAWTHLDLDVKCLVYPAPDACDLEALLAMNQNDGTLTILSGQDDFYGLREYISGDSLKHVAWKHYARGQGMFTKQYASQMSEQVWLDWDMFAGMSTETRLSRLCYCTLELDKRSMDFGLKLPDRKISPSHGNEHLRRILKTLALYRLDQSAGEEGVES